MQIYWSPHKSPTTFHCLESVAMVFSNGVGMVQGCRMSVKEDVGEEQSWEMPGTSDIVTKHGCYHLILCAFINKYKSWIISCSHSISKGWCFWTYPNNKYCFWNQVKDSFRFLLYKQTFAFFCIYIKFSRAHNIL